MNFNVETRVNNDETNDSSTLYKSEYEEGSNANQRADKYPTMTDPTDSTELIIDSKNTITTLCNDQLFKIDFIGEDMPNNTSRCNHDKRLFDLDTKISQCIDQNSLTHTKLDDFRTSLNFLLHKLGYEKEVFSDLETNDEDVKDDLKTSLSGQLSKLDEIDCKISHCVVSNERTHMKIDNLQKLLDMILRNVNTQTMKMTATEEEPEPVADNEGKVTFQFPIISLYTMNVLEKELHKNPNLKSELIIKFTKIAGDSGRKSAKKVGIKIVEKIISPKLLNKFSWTGRKNGMHDIKLAFMTYTAIIDLCLQVISKADNSFDSSQCEYFLRNSVLKHCSQRLARTFTKKLKRKNCERMCLRQKLDEDISVERTERNRYNEQSVLSDKVSDIEEVADPEWIVDSKENIKTNSYREPEEQNSTKPLDNSFLEECNHTSKLDTMDRKITDCIESNVKVHSKLDLMQKTLIKILNKVACDRETSSSPDPCADEVVEAENELNAFSFPLNTVSDMREFNRKLATSKRYEKEMVRKFISSTGISQNVSIQSYGVEVVESVLSPQLLTNFSWTGRSKGSNPKLPFIKYTSVIRLFHKIFSEVDDRFSKKKCENFLKFNVLKIINIRTSRTSRKHAKNDFDDPIRSSVEETSMNNDEIEMFSKSKDKSESDCSVVILES